MTSASPNNHQAATETPAKANANFGVAFLPDLCNIQAVFLLVLLGELLALLLTIADYGLERFNWDKLGLISVQIQWIVLLSAVCLCRLRFWLGNLSQVQAGTFSYALVMFITLFLCLLGQWLIYAMSGLILLEQQHFQINYWQLINNLAVAAILAGTVLRYLYLQQQLQNQREAEMQARIQALQSRIRPHFLFNSMNSIASLIASAPETAERVVEDLSDLFRASLAEPALIPLERELNLCKQYLDIEQLRLSSRLQVEWQISDFDKHLRIPSLMLQPIVENAIFHGIEPLPQGGKVCIKLSQTEKQLRIVITNPYPLVRKNYKASNTQDTAGRHNSMALDNIRRRLIAHYGAAARLSSSAENGVFTTYIFCPVLV